MCHEFSTTYFDNRNSVLLGKFFFKSGDNGASAFSKYHFRDHFHQCSSFRLIKPSDPDAEIVKIIRITKRKKRVSDLSA